MPEKIVKNLLMHVFYPLSAIVSVGRKGTVKGLCLFDTKWGTQHIRIRRNAAEIWLLSSHPEGCMEPYEEDIRHMRIIRALSARTKLRFFIVNEDVGCVEIDLETHAVL